MDGLRSSQWRTFCSLFYLSSTFLLQDLINEASSTPNPDLSLSAPSPNGDSSEKEDGGGEKGSCIAQQLSPDARRAVGAAILKLGLQLLEKLKTGPEQPNVIISPLSISLALSQLALGEKMVVTGGLGVPISDCACVFN